jgi:hypothetical protein
MNGYLCDYENCHKAAYPDEIEGWIKVFFATVEGDGFVDTPSYFCSPRCLAKHVKENQ